MLKGNITFKYVKESSDVESINHNQNRDMECKAPDAFIANGKRF